tara:strand:+ start:133 stop:516 length:384 start_codon:yes stop_codon:yes gene_type:complete
MKITNNFNKIEFESKDGAKMPLLVLDNIKILALQLQIIRDYICEPIHISSAYRSPSHNAKIGGVSNSQHTKGKAADLSTKSFSSIELHRVIEKLISENKILNGGVGLYNGFVHYDIRKSPARWDYRK